MCLNNANYRGSPRITSIQVLKMQINRQKHSLSNICLTILKRASFLNSRSSFNSNMVFPQVIAAFYALFDAIGLPGNLLVILTIVLERRFHVMRYILLASLALSDFLLLILANSFRILSMVHERWLYGETMCHLNPFFVRYFYLNTVLHLVAVSYERYSAIVKSPLTYDGTISKTKVLFIVLIWVIPIPLSIGPFFGFSGGYDYNPEVFYCEQGWSVQRESSKPAIFLVIASFVVPFLVILFLNWSVYKTAKRQIIALEVQVGSIAGSVRQRQEMSRRKSERKAAVDVSIIIAAFLVCFLPGWFVGIFRRFVRSMVVPVEVVQITSCLFFTSTVCNPIIYSVWKRDFQVGVKNVFRRIGLCASSNDMDNNVIAMNNLRFIANHGTQVFFAKPASALATQHQDGRLSPLPEIQQIEEESPNDIDSNETAMNNLRFGDQGSQVSPPKPTAVLVSQHQDGRLSLLPEIQQIEEESPNDIDNNVTAMNNLTFGDRGIQVSPPKPAAVFVTQHQDGRLCSILDIQQMEEACPNDIENNSTGMNRMKAPLQTHSPLEIRMEDCLQFEIQ